jgi:RNA polymerase sigma factor (sigma-70 family)
MDETNTISLYHVDSALTRAPLFFTNNDSPADKDSKIWTAFRQGNREALDYIFKEHASNLFAYGTRFTRDQDLVLDCIQDLFVELWNRRQTLNETTSIKFYLLKALRRRIARTVHGAKRLEAITDEVQYLEEKMNFSVEQLMVAQESDQARKAGLRRALEGLTKRQRESIYLKFFQGLNNEAIASVMGLSEASAATLVSQSIAALRNALPKKS